MTVTCELCQKAPAQALWSNEKLFVIDAHEARFPGFLRIVWKEHVAEMSDLSQDDRSHLFEVINTIEEVMRRTMNPDKVNWAQFGNMVPHVHWHLIPRYKDDSHFPESVWGAQQRDINDAALRERQAASRLMIEEMIKVLNRQFKP